MELLDLQSLLNDPNKLVKTIIDAKSAAQIVKTEDIKKQYDPKLHPVMDPGLRQDKSIETDKGPDIAKVARLPIPLQKRIVRLASAFLCGNPIALDCAPENDQEQDYLDVILKTWNDNKLDYKSKQLAKLMMAETETAELWYTEEAEPGYWANTANDLPRVKYKLRMKILAPSLGDSLYPVFNIAGDMIAFGRGYELKDANNKAVEHFDLYTSDRFYFYEKQGDGQGLALVKDVENEIKKIPVIYYCQDYPEWYDVEELIERIEKLISNHADTNDYHGSPTVKVRGIVKGYAKKGEAGKIIELEGDNADANYMEWNHATDSIKLEFENLMNLVHALTDTPNISFEQMKGLGTFSGIALKMLFLGAHLKAADHEENFGEGIQRRINYIKAAMANINVDFEKLTVFAIKPKFTFFLPKNELEMVEMLTIAVNGKILSKKTAVMLNPLVSDPEVENQQLTDEAQSADNLNSLFLQQ